MLSDETDQLLQAPPGAARQERLAALFTAHRDRLRLMVEFRIDPAVQGRVDPSDVLQESFIEVSRRIDEYVDRRPMPFYLWLRRITIQKLLEIRRHHIGVAARDARREVRLGHGTGPEVSSVLLASHLVARQGSPSEEVSREETRAAVQATLEKLGPLDREVLALRHFEGLSNAETAAALGIKESAASLRYVRALDRLEKALPAHGQVRENGS